MDNISKQIPYLGVHRVSITMYHNYKRKLQKLEANNANRIYVIPCSGDGRWFEMAERSALFYHHEIVTLLGLKTKFTEDVLSQYDKYSYGYIRNCNLADLRKKLVENQLYKTEGYTDKIFYFELNKNFSDEKIEQMWEAEQQRRLNNNSIKAANNMSPELYLIICLLGRSFHQICNSKMNKATVGSLGVRMLDNIDDISITYHQITYLDKSPEKALAKWSILRTKLYELQIMLKIAGDFDIWRRDRIISFEDNIDHAIKIVERIMRRLIKRQQEQEEKEQEKAQMKQRREAKARKKQAKEESNAKENH